MRSPVFSSDGQKIYVGRGDGNIEILSTQQKMAAPKLVETIDNSGNTSTKAYNLFSA